MAQAAQPAQAAKLERCTWQLDPPVMETFFGIKYPGRIELDGIPSKYVKSFSGAVEKFPVDKVKAVAALLNVAVARYWAEQEVFNFSTQLAREADRGATADCEMRRTPDGGKGYFYGVEATKKMNAMHAKIDRLRKEEKALQKPLDVRHVWIHEPQQAQAK